MGAAVRVGGTDIVGFYPGPIVRVVCDPPFVGRRILEGRVEPIAISIPLVVGATAVAATIVINALAVAATVHFVRRERRIGHAGAGFWTDVVIVAVTISFALCAHLLDIGVWAILFMVCGEFPTFGGAYYHSAVN